MSVFVGAGLVHQCPRHPLRSEKGKARCSLGSPHTQTSLEDDVFELFCMRDAMDSLNLRENNKGAAVASDDDFLLQLSMIHGCTAGRRMGDTCNLLPGTCSSCNCIGRLQPGIW